MLCFRSSMVLELSFFDRFVDFPGMSSLKSGV